MDLKEGEHYYIDKRTGLLVFTEKYHLERGYCCNSGCRHCPYRMKKGEKTDPKLEEAQQAICRKYNADFYPSNMELKLGIAENVKSGILPLNGLRQPVEADTCGWYIWAGEEFSTAPDFFKAIHVSHINEWSPLISKYLALPPGYRFLTDGTYEDVWYDASLLDIDK